MSQLIRIVAVLVDQQQLLMYKADGTTIRIPQGDPRIRPLVNLVVPELKRREAAGLHVYMDLTEDQIYKDPMLIHDEDHSHYAEAEKKMGGVVKFFRMAKSKLKELVDSLKEKPEPDTTPVDAIGLVGHVPAAELPVQEDPDDEEDEGEDDSSAPLTKSLDVANEIIARATPAHAPAFATEAKEADTTVVAVLEDGTIIPGMENLSMQLRDTAAKLGTPTGILKFFERVSSVPRAHSVADLLKFMEKGELPIADDGTILVYKRLRSTNEEGVFVDCHSRKVKQRVGSHVFMDESLVDPDRRTECSNGLHVARRDYLSSFSGDICVLAKLAPEDVIAVPHADARKLRAKGYFIIAQLSQADHDAVTSNRKLSDTNLLGNAVAGNHTPILETVQITESRGGGVIITPVNQLGSSINVDSTLHAKPLAMPEDVMEENKSVDAAELGKTSFTVTAVDQGKPGGDHTAEVTLTDGVITDIKVTEAKYATAAPAKPAEKMSPAHALEKAFVDAPTIKEKQEAAAALVAYKKKAKKSWMALGISAAVADDAQKRANATVTVNEVIHAPPGNMKVKGKSLGKAKKVPAPKEPKPKAKAPAKKEVKLSPVASAVLGAAKPSVNKKPAKKTDQAKANVAMAKGSLEAQPALKTTMEKAAQSLPKGKPKNDDKMIKLSLADQAAALYKAARNSGTKADYQALLAFKKSKKKSWELLGLTRNQVDNLTK